MSKLHSLRPHPRLYIGEPELRRVADDTTAPRLQAAVDCVAHDGEQFVQTADFAFNDHTHNSLLVRARLMQTRVVTLLVRWWQTGEPRFREAAIEHVRQMDRWRYWSWIARRRGMDDPEAIFDLSYGENSATLAIAYTILHHTLTNEEAHTFHDIATRRALHPFLVMTGGEKKPHWFAKPGSNWNTVCAGGAGMLALAMHEDCDDTDEVLRRSETSIEPYMRGLDATAGAWPEGIGYWNYGMRYAFMYLLSHERATGAAHPRMEHPATAATLRFPLDFCPNNVPCSFGDVNRWKPLPFHYAAADRFGDTTLLRMLDEANVPPDPAQRDDHPEPWPNEPELLLLHPRRQTDDAPAPTYRVLKRYPQQDWCLLADRWPQPNLYTAIRGGTTKVPHSHRDLLSFNLVIGDEQLIQNAQNAEYLDTTFGQRRQELIEINPQGKSTVLLNGVGITTESSVQTDTFEADAIKAVRLDGTDAMGMQNAAGAQQSAARGCYRLFALLGDNLLLVIDRVLPTFPGRVETRFHTQAALDLHGTNRAILTGKRRRLHATFACDVAAAVHTAELPLTSPNRSPTLRMVRFCTDDLHESITMAAAFCADHEPTVHINADDSRITINVECNGQTYALRTGLSLETPTLV